MGRPSKNFTDEQVEKLLNTIRELPPYVFVMIGLYAGLKAARRAPQFSKR